MIFFMLELLLWYFDVFCYVDNETI